MEEIRRRDFLALGFSLATGLAAEALNIDAGVSNTAEPIQPSVPIKLTFNGNVLRFQGAWCDVPNWRLAIEVGGELLKSENAKVEIVSGDPLHARLHFEAHQIIWDLESETDAANNRVLLHSTVLNESQRPAPLGRAFLLQADAINGFFRSGDKVVYLPMSSGQQLNQISDLNSSATSDIAIQTFNQTQTRAFQVGFATFLRAKTQIEHRCSSAKGLQVSAWCDFDGWELPPESSTPTETMTIAVGRDPHSQLEAWGDIAARLCQTRPREWEEQPHGWLGWSWVDPIYVERYEDVILRNAKAIRERLAGFGIDYIWESIGNLKDGQPGNWLNWNDKYFPNGHQYLHDELEHLGIKWGLWCGAFMLSSKLKDKVSELWDALVKQPDREQPMVYMPNWGYGLDNPTEDYKNPIYALDPSHPKTLAFLKEVFQTYRAWGVRYYMIDFLWAGSDTLSKIPHARHYDQTLVSGPEVFRKGLETIRDACGDDTHLLAATGPTYHTAGVMDAVRTGNDFGEGRPMGIGFTTYPGTYVLKPLSHWNGPVHALSNQASTYHTHRRLYINNSGNVLTVDKPLQLNQAQINATIHALSGGPSMLGDDICYIEEERLNLIKKTLPRPLDVAIPVDLFTRKERGYPRVYHRKVTSPSGTYNVIAIYNLDETQVLKEEIALNSIGLDESRPLHVWKFWNTEYVGRVHSRLSAEVPPYTVKVYRLTEDTGIPVVIGTDMHVTMGEVEVDCCRWDATRKILSGRAIRPQGERGNVFIYGPPKMGVENPKGYFIGKDIDNDCLVIRCPLQFEDGTAEWSINFYNLASATPYQAPF